MTVLDWYREPLFWLFPVGSLVASMVAFVLFAAPLTWIAWAEPAWARPHRLQSRPPRDQQLVAASVRSWLVNNAFLAGATVASWPLLRLTGVHACRPPGAVARAGPQLAAKPSRRP